jgi:trk system potassium uptake protein TrkA
MYKLVDGSVEALEFKIHNHAPFLGITLKDLKLKSNVLIAGIVRGGKIIIPGGSDTMQKGDSVIVVAKSSRFDDLNDIFR